MTNEEKQLVAAIVAAIREVAQRLGKPGMAVSCGVMYPARDIVFVVERKSLNV